MQSTYKVLKEKKEKQNLQCSAMRQRPFKDAFEFFMLVSYWWGRPLRVVHFFSENPLEKTKFSFASSY